MLALVARWLGVMAEWDTRPHVSAAEYRPDHLIWSSDDVHQGGFFLVSGLRFTSWWPLMAASSQTMSH